MRISRLPHQRVSHSFALITNTFTDLFLVAANTFMRSLCGAGFPLFATYMFNGMGIQWASTMLGILALILVPVPVYFMLRGEKIRAKSKFAPTRFVPKADGPMDEEKSIFSE